MDDKVVPLRKPKTYGETAGMTLEQRADWIVEALGGRNVWLKADLRSRAIAALREHEDEVRQEVAPNPLTAWLDGPHKPVGFVE